MQEELNLRNNTDFNANASLSPDTCADFNRPPASSMGSPNESPLFKQNDPKWSETTISSSAQFQQ